jgi:hypothetical protein
LTRRLSSLSPNKEAIPSLRQLVRPTRNISKLMLGIGQFATAIWLPIDVAICDEKGQSDGQQTSPEESEDKLQHRKE